MSHLIVYRASAGSGKTYRLASEYIKQVLKSPENYKKILAVTFTNKATAEMKGRIVDELFILSQGEKSGMGDEIANEMGITLEVLKQKAQKALSLILHDYSLFSVSTIDSFVQRVIQALLWEIGEQGGAEIQLDTEPVLTHAADNLLDSASQFDELLRWLSLMGENLMEEGGSWDVRRKLIVLGQQIFSESFRLMDSTEIEIFTDKKNVEKLKEILQKLIKDIIEKINYIANEAVKEIHRSGIDPDVFKGKQSGIIGFFNKCIRLELASSELPDISLASVKNCLPDPSGEAWVIKETFKNTTLFTPIQLLVQNVLHPKLTELVGIIESERRRFVSARLIMKNLENLALIGDLWHKVRELSKQEGFLLLSDSGHLLREFVKDTDAPFVYEKIGNRYDSFMIDEFQDTSVVQWHNFKPLIENSLSQDSFSMLVGDVKQSIYRWRNGDWRILAQGVEQDFLHHGMDERFLSTNWRSQPEIVRFNNTFFQQAVEIIAAQIQQKTSEINPGLCEMLVQQVQNAYKDIEQTPKVGLPENGGYVEVRLFEKENNEDYEEQLNSHLPQQIVQLKERHSLGDIAILVRGKVDGQRVANMFLDYNRTISNHNDHIHFVSQEGLFLKSSSVVRLMIAAFRLVQNPDDQIYRRVLAKEKISLSENSICDWHEVFSDRFIEEETQWLGGLITLTLQETFEAIVSRYSLSNIKGELAYLAELHEVILAQSSRGSADVSRFMEWWDDNSEKLSLSVPESSNALSIITIHKSKGLEFPVVIVPYANWPFRVNNRPPLLWVSSNEKPFDLLPRYPIYSTKMAEESFFAQEALEENLKEVVDNLNLLYVAFTRSQQELYVYVPHSKSENNKKEIRTISALIMEVMPGIYQKNTQSNVISSNNEGIFCFGEIKQLHKMDEHQATVEKGWKIENYNVGINHGGIKLKQESLEFFKSMPSDGISAKEHGKIMHLLFSMITDSSQVDDAIHMLAVEGLIELNDCESISLRVKELLLMEPFKQWFAGDWKVKAEATVLTPSGKAYRPDRVMIKENRAIVVDFKFGAEKQQHKKQVGQYAHLLKEMGYNDVKAFLWYVDKSNLVELNN